MTSAQEKEGSKVPAGPAKLGPYFTDEEALFLRRNLLKWYDENRRLLPWRGDPPPYGRRGEQEACEVESCAGGAGALSRTSRPPGKLGDPYGTWVSEIMLQQTRVDAVIKHWLQWMVKFPTVADLASASEDEVHAMWAGLGYYRRAANLLKGAKQVMEEFKGEMPRTAAELKKIHGIGDYTAGAICSIAYDLPEPLVDGNVIRVLSRIRTWELDAKSSVLGKQCWSAAKEILDVAHPGDFNQALMELGATVCEPANPRCGECPVAQICRARQEADKIEVGNVGSDASPVPKKKAKASNSSAVPQRTLFDFGISGKPADTVPPPLAMPSARDRIAHIVSHYPLKPAKKENPTEGLVAVVLCTPPLSIAEKEPPFISYLLVKPKKPAASTPGEKRKSAADETDLGATGRLKGALLSGQWQPLCIPAEPDLEVLDAINTAYGLRLAAEGPEGTHVELEECGGVRHVFSHVTHNVRVIRASIAAAAIPSGHTRAELEKLEVVPPDSPDFSYKWVSPADFADVGLTTWNCKILSRVVGRDFLQFSNLHAKFDDHVGANAQKAGWGLLKERCEKANTPIRLPV